MKNEQRRHDISDEVWELISPLLPRQVGQWGGIAQDNRLFMNAVFWNLRTGAPWRDLPPEYGKWGTPYTNHDMHPIRARFPVKTEQTADGIIFYQQGRLNRDLAYSYEKKIKLQPDGGFSIAHSLKNDGESPWQTLWYSHAFFAGQHGRR